jgi:hypothetical protein
VKYASEEDARRSIGALNETRLDAEHVLRMGRVEGSETFTGLVESGIVDEGEVRRLTTL